MAFRCVSVMFKTDHGAYKPLTFYSGAMAIRNIFIAFLRQHRCDVSAVVFFDGMEVIAVHVSADGNKKIPRGTPALRCPAVVALPVMLFGLVLYSSHRPEWHG